MNKCKQCGMETSNPIFCSRSCSAIFNNKGINRYGFDIRRVCNCCGGPKGKFSKKCISCTNKDKYIESCEVFIGTILNNNAKYTASKYNHVREHARKTMKFYNIPKTCKLCNHSEFDDVVEVCHIKQVTSFDLDTKLKVVNSLDNLLYLCPSHHSMMDKGLINTDCVV